MATKVSTSHCLKINELFHPTNFDMDKCVILTHKVLNIWFRIPCQGYSPSHMQSWTPRTHRTGPGSFNNLHKWLMWTGNWHSFLTEMPICLKRCQPFSQMRNTLSVSNICRGTWRTGYDIQTVCIGLGWLPNYDIVCTHQRLSHLIRKSNNSTNHDVALQPNS